MRHQVYLFVVRSGLWMASMWSLMHGPIILGVVGLVTLMLDMILHVARKDR